MAWDEFLKKMKPVKIACCYFFKVSIFTIESFNSIVELVGHKIWAVCNVPSLASAWIRSKEPLVWADYPRQMAEYRKQRTNSTTALVLSRICCFVFDPSFTFGIWILNMSYVRNYWGKSC